MNPAKNPLVRAQRCFKTKFKDQLLCIHCICNIYEQKIWTFFPLGCGLVL